MSRDESNQSGSSSSARGTEKETDSGLRISLIQALKKEKKPANIETVVSAVGKSKIAVAGRFKRDGRKQKW